MSKEILEKLAEMDQRFRELNDQSEKEIQKHGEVLATTAESIDKIEKAIAEKEAELEQRLDDVELKLDTPAQERSGVSDVEKRHVDAFENWIRHRDDHTAQSELLECAKEAEEHLRGKAVDTTAGATGGYAVPEVIGQMVREKLIDISPMRSLVRVVNVGTSDYKELIDVAGETGGWAGETDARTETGTPGVEECAPTMGTLYAYPKATEESLDDIFFNVQEWLVRSIVRTFAKHEGEAFVSGDGSNKPTGFIGTPSAVADDGASPERPYGTIQYVANGETATWSHAPGASPQVHGGDVLIDLEQALKPGYRANASYLMNKSTLGVIRKFKDIDGNYMWQRSMAAGQPSTINGYPVVEMEAMASIGANAFPVALGDFEEGYLAVDRIGMRMNVDPITTPGYVKFYVRRRQGGKTYNDDAIKVVKIATS